MLRQNKDLCKSSKNTSGKLMQNFNYSRWQEERRASIKVSLCEDQKEKQENMCTLRPALDRCFLSSAASRSHKSWQTRTATKWSCTSLDWDAKKSEKTTSTHIYTFIWQVISSPKSKRRSRSSSNGHLSTWASTWRSCLVSKEDSQKRANGLKTSLQQPFQAVKSRTFQTSIYSMRRGSWGRDSTGSIQLLFRQTESSISFAWSIRRRLPPTSITIQFMSTGQYSRAESPVALLMCHFLLNYQMTQRSLTQEMLLLRMSSSILWNSKA